MVYTLGIYALINIYIIYRYEYRMIINIIYIHILLYGIYYNEICNESIE